MEKNVSFTRKLVLTAAFSALIIVLGITKLGLIPIGPAASITILHVPIILAACLIGLPYALFTGAVFGIMSLVQAAMSPSGVLDPLFVNPLVSVLPRMLVGLIAWALWKLFTNISKLSKENIIGIIMVFFGLLIILFTNILPTPTGIGLSIVLASLLWLILNNSAKIPLTVFAGITAFLSTVCHTLLVIGSLYLFQGAATREGMGGMGYFAVIGVLAPQAALEAVAATIICSAVYVGLFVSSKRKSKLSQEAATEE